MSKRRRRVRDKWRSKRWYTVVSPSYFGGVELGSVPSSDPQNLVGRVIESTLSDMTNDFAHQYLKIRFQVIKIDGRRALTTFKGHEYSRDYLRSLVRRRTTRVDGIFNITTKDNYKVRASACALTLTRIRTSQEDAIRKIMKNIIEEKAKILTFDQFVQEAVLGKIASDIYNEAKKITALRHVGVRKTKALSYPSEAIEQVANPAETTKQAAEAPTEG